MLKKLIISGFILLAVSANQAISQTYHTNSNRALNSYVAGKMEYDKLYFESAENLLKDAIKTDNNFYEAYMLLGEMMSKLRRFPESVQYYRKAVQIDSLFYRPVFFSLANAEMMSGLYEDAMAHFNIYIIQPGVSEKNKKVAIKNIEVCKFGAEAVKKPVPFQPVNLGDSVNTTNDEYWPSITVDGKTLIFTRQEVSGRANSNQEDFYLSQLINDKWSIAENAGFPLNTSGNEGAQTISSDGSYMYFTACDKPGSLGRCDIYYSAYEGKNWLLPQNIGSPVNTSAWESQPSISANGRMLFFVSNRPGGIGGMDIWYSVMGSNGNWKDPVNPGKTINTTGDEMSPFIHFDGKTLYFSSNGITGMGGHDLYFSKMKDDTTWTDPKNLGYPINTFNDEMGLIIDATGQKAYYSSRKDNKRGKDIYSFSLYESARPSPVSYFKGNVHDRETGKLLEANYELVDLNTGHILTSNNTGRSGTFLLCLPSNHNYGLNVSKPGYLFYSDNFMFRGIHSLSEPYNKRIDLSPVKVGEKMVLSNVFYEFDQWNISPESFSELIKLSRLLLDNKNVTVEIGGYTDSVGTEAYNLDLSEKRAKSVMTYLIGKGIKADRLKYKGYGSLSPIGDNVTDDGRKLNRRTEIRITGISVK